MAFFAAGRSRGGGKRWTPLVCSFGVGISPHESLRGELRPYREGPFFNVEPAQARRQAQRAALVRIRVSIEHVHAEHNHKSIRSVSRKGTRPVENLSPPPI